MLYVVIRISGYIEKLMDKVALSWFVVVALGILGLWNIVLPLRNRERNEESFIDDSSQLPAASYPKPLCEYLARADMHDYIIGDPPLKSDFDETFEYSNDAFQSVLSRKVHKQTKKASKHLTKENRREDEAEMKQHLDTALNKVMTILNSTDELALDDGGKLAPIATNANFFHPPVIDFDVVVYRDGKPHGKYINVVAVVETAKTTLVNAEVLGVVKEDQIERYPTGNDEKWMASDALVLEYDESGLAKRDMEKERVIPPTREEAKRMLKGAR